MLRTFAAGSRSAPTFEPDVGTRYREIESSEENTSDLSQTESLQALSTGIEPNSIEETALFGVAGDVAQKQLSRLESNAY